MTRIDHPPSPHSPPYALGPFCLTCNYRLRGLPDPRCPECGRAFDPLRPETMNLSGRPMGAFARWLMQPVGWLTHLLALYALLCPAWELRRPHGDFHAFLLAIALWFIVIVIWLGRHAIRHAVRAFYQRPASELARGRWNWLVAPILLAIWVFLPQHLPQRIAFAMSRKPLDRFVVQVMTNPAAMTGTHRAGLYWVRVDGVCDGGVLLFTGFGYDAARCGFAYFPYQPPPPTDERDRNYHQVDGRWYEYWDHGWPRQLPATLPATFPSAS